MRYVKSGIVPYLEFEIFDKWREMIGHGVSLRAGGVSEGGFASLNLGICLGDSDENLAENYRRFGESTGFDMAETWMAKQEHTDGVMVVREGGRGFREPVAGVDAFITNVIGVPLVVRMADCQAVLILDPMKRVIAAVHSGWKGNAKNIIGKTVAKMKAEFGVDPADLLVGISQSLGPDHAEFENPFDELPEEMHKFVEGNLVDLWKCSEEQLAAEGVLPENIEFSRRCTVCESEEFFSHRKGKGTEGRMAGVVFLK